MNRFEFQNNKEKHPDKQWYLMVEYCRLKNCLPDVDIDTVHLDHKKQLMVARLWKDSGLAEAYRHLVDKGLEPEEIKLDHCFDVLGSD